MYTGTWHENTYVVTGSSGSGKSEVCKLLAEFGAKIVSADDLARQALAPGSKALLEVLQAFGDKVFSGDSLNRKALGEIIFKDSKERLKLEGITHPVIAKLAEEAFGKLSQAGGQILVYDCPLFFETKLKDERFKGIIFITANPDLKISRLIARDGITEIVASQRLASQLSDKERIPLSNFVIENNGTLLELKFKVKEIFDRL